MTTGKLGQNRPPKIGTAVRPGAVTAAGVLLTTAGVVTAISLLISLVQGTGTVLSVLLVAVLDAVLFKAGAQALSSLRRGWPLGGGWTLIGMAGVVLISLSSQLDALIYESSRHQLATTLVITAAVYCAAGLTVLVLMSRRSAVRYYFSR